MSDEQIGQELESVQSEVTTEETQAELPVEANERTKQQFEKLKQHNKELLEELERAKAQPKPSESALGSLNPQVSAVAPNLTQDQVQDIVKGLVDENGYLDSALLENTLRQANREVAEAKAVAEQARQEAIQARQAVSKFEETREVRIAHKKFPSVDPDSKSYDPHFYKLVKNELLGAMYEGRKVSFVDACREVSQVYTPKTGVSETKAKAVEEYKKDVALKSTLNETGKSRPDTKISKDDLVEGTRKGDAQSIYDRLKNINS